jgi:hypothetical protein
LIASAEDPAAGLAGAGAHDREGVLREYWPPEQQHEPAQTETPSSVSVQAAEQAKFSIIGTTESSSTRRSSSLDSSRLPDSPAGTLFVFERKRKSMFCYVCTTWISQLKLVDFLLMLLSNCILSPGSRIFIECIKSQKAWTLWKLLSSRAM